MASKPKVGKKSGIETDVKGFYDEFWPAYLPSQEDIEETQQHLRQIIPDKRWESVLDAGCGLGICTVGLSDMGEKVVGFDISSGSLEVADNLAKRLEKNNIEFHEGNLMELPFEDEAFDLILCWGVLMYVPSAEKVFKKLVRCLRKDGTLVVAAHRKSALTPVHHTVQRICARIPRPARGVTIKTMALSIKTIATLLNRRPARADLSFEGKVEDFYFVPFKRWFSTREMNNLFAGSQMSCETVMEFTGRFKSTSSFIVRGTKR